MPFAREKATPTYFGAKTRALSANIVPHLLIFILVAFSLPIFADNCSERLIKEAHPDVPGHRTPQKIVEAGGSCPIYLTYDLSEQGKPENITADAEQQVCEYFYDSAKKALLRSKFAVGVPESGCEHEYTFSLEP